ncbi:MAG: hypothetical protein ACYC64_08020 [Armatimonadota bacterium]
MRYFATHIQDRRIAFLGQADSYTLLTRATPDVELLRQLKLACLLYDHVVFAAAYFWQSRDAWRVISAVEPLVQSGAILPAIRAPEGSRNIIEYFERRVEDTRWAPVAFIADKPALLSEIAMPEQRPQATQLENMGAILHLDATSVSGTFSNKWWLDTFDESDPDSLYNCAYLSLPQASRESVMMSLRLMLINAEYFGRCVAAEHILSLEIPAELQQTLIRRTSDLYLRANAETCHGVLVTDRSSTTGWIRLPHTFLGPLDYSNVDLFHHVLGTIGLPDDQLMKLTPQDVECIRLSAELRGFLPIYNSLIDAGLQCEQNVRGSLLDQFEALRSQDQDRRRLLKALKSLRLASGTLFVAALGAYLADPGLLGVLLGSGAGGAASHLLSKLEYWQHTPVLDFIDYLGERRYEKTLLERTLGSSR